MLFYTYYLYFGSLDLHSTCVYTRDKYKKMVEKTNTNDFTVINSELKLWRNKKKNNK